MLKSARPSDATVMLGARLLHQAVHAVNHRTTRFFPISSINRDLDGLQIDEKWCFHLVDGLHQMARVWNDTNYGNFFEF